MYRLNVKKEKQRYVLEELTKEFLRPGEYEVFVEEAVEDSGSGGSENGAGRKKISDEQRRAENEERDAEKRRVFDELAELTGYRPEWGTLTGVRPAKLANELMDSGLSEEETADVFRRRYYVSDEKIGLLMETCRNQKFLTSVPAGRTAGVYIGIPFCPTRCLYCSFASNQASTEAMDRYLEALLKEVKEELEALRAFLDIGEGSIEVDETEDIDWINNWKQYFKQFYVDDILIVPSWEEVKAEDQDKMILHIDPGTAFGTGMHETTQLVIRQLKKYVKEGCELLDVGTGSGILGITALKLGAGHVVGTDLDPCAVPAVQENKEANQIPDKAFDMMIGNIIDDKEVQDQVGYEKYDIVAANILADVLVPLTPVIVHQMKKGAYYITSGILDVKESVVTEAVKNAGLTLVEVTKQGEWVSVTARKD